MFKNKFSALKNQFVAVKSGKIIYQMGKVGSSSISRSTKRKIAHCHSYGISFSKYFFNKKLSSVDYFQFVIKRIFLLLYKLRRKKKILTLVRDPVSRNVSALFQVIDSENMKSKSHTFESLLAFFEKNISHDTPLVWFDKEIKKYFGIDVYQYPFDKQRGLTIIKEGNIELMIIKMENLNDFEKEIGSFFRIENFKLMSANTGENKWYADLYQDFKSEFKPSKDYLDSLYDTKYMRHFYSDSEIEDFKNKWSS